MSCWRVVRRNGGYTALNRRWVDEAVITALDVWMILVARDQKDGPRIAVRKHSLAGNLSAVIDVVCAFPANAGAAR